MAVGYIYVLTNPAMPGLVKIGHTTDVQRRVKELSTATGVPSTFVVELFQLTADAAETEALIDTSLDVRVSPDPTVNRMIQFCRPCRGSFEHRLWPRSF
jgi:T5orf172 domain